MLLSPAAFEALVESPVARADVGPSRGCAVVAVDCRGGLPHDAALAAAASLPLVVVGVGTDGGSFDVTVASDPDAQAVIAAVDAHPLAAVTLVQLLRLGGALSPSHALVVESMAYATLQGGPEFAQWLAARGTRVRRPETHPPVLAERDGGALHITLNRPRVFNLYNAAMRDALVEALTVAVAEPVLPVELTGAGRSFCAGGDPAEFGAVTDPATAHAIRSTANAAPYLEAVRDRLHVTVHGACVGAGVELAAFAGRVTARGDAFFELPEVSMGLLPGAGGTVSVTRRIGRRRAAWLALTGARIDAPTAHAWGLVDELV